MPYIVGVPGVDGHQLSTARDTGVTRVSIQYQQSHTVQFWQCFWQLEKLERILGD